MVEYLLENKANYRQQACHGLTIFHYCIQHGDYPCMECLCKYAKADLLPPASPTQRYSLDISDTDGITPLMLACKMGQDSFVRLLIQYKANLELRSFRGDNAMTFALTLYAIDVASAYYTYIHQLHLHNLYSISTAHYTLMYI